MRIGERGLKIGEVYILQDVLRQHSDYPEEAYGNSHDSLANHQGNGNTRQYPNYEHENRRSLPYEREGTGVC